MTDSKWQNKRTPETTKTFFEQEIERLIREDAVRAHHYAYIRQSKALMDKYHGEKIQLDKIAATAHMSSFNISAYSFQQIYGRTSP